MKVQNQYWQELTQIKARIEYLDGYSDRLEQLNNGLNVIVAVAGTGSIAAWAIWDVIEFVWPAIIAFSQVIQAVKPVVPLGKRLKALPLAVFPLRELLIHAESTWFSIARGRMTEKEIHERWIGLKREHNKIVREKLKGVTLPDNKKLKKRAEDQTQRYFKNYYGVGGQR